MRISLLSIFLVSFCILGETLSRDTNLLLRSKRFSPYSSGDWQFTTESLGSPSDSPWQYSTKSWDTYTSESPWQFTTESLGSPSESPWQVLPSGDGPPPAPSPPGGSSPTPPPSPPPPPPSGPCQKLSGDCGRRDINTGTRIVGGDQAREKEIVRLTFDGDTGCGGTVISDSWVLTAAHCIHETKHFPSSIKVHAGDHDARVVSRRDEQVKSVAQIIEHEQYNPRTVDNDFALLKLSTPLNLNTASVKRVCLPESCQTDTGCAPNNQAYIAGWGTMKEDGDTATVLQHAKVPIQSSRICNRQQGGGLTRNMICAGLEGGGVDTCQGDSGGPMMVEMADKSLKLCGVTSFGQGCAQPDSFGVYAKVCTAMNWIKAKTGICDFS